MRGTSFLNFINDSGTLTDLSDSNKIIDKIAMLILTDVNGVAFLRTTSNNGLIDFVYQLHSELPDPVIKYRIKSLIESNIRECTVTDMRIERRGNRLDLKILVYYRGRELEYGTSLGGIR